MWNTRAINPKPFLYYTAEARVDSGNLSKFWPKNSGYALKCGRLVHARRLPDWEALALAARSCIGTWLAKLQNREYQRRPFTGDFPLNPLKLAGQCGKLKCCLNYELDAYAEALKEFLRKLWKENA